MFRRGPLTFADDGQSGAVNDEVQAGARAGAPKREGEMLTASRERGVIGGREIDAQHPEDRGQEALGLTQRSVEEETERQGGFDGEIGILELPAPPADASRCPRGDRVGREPEGDVASPHEGSIVLGPVPDAIRCLVLRMHSRLHIEIMTRCGRDGQHAGHCSPTALNQRTNASARRGDALTGLVHHSDAGSQYLSMRYTDRLVDAGIAPLVGSQGDAYDNALAESVIGLYKTEVIRRKGPWRTLEAVEFATLTWVDWFNTRRLLGPLGDIPPAEFEAQYYEQAAVGIVRLIRLDPKNLQSRTIRLQVDATRPGRRLGLV